MTAFSQQVLNDYYQLFIFVEPVFSLFLALEKKGIRNKEMKLNIFDFILFLFQIFVNLNEQNLYMNAL